MKPSLYLFLISLGIALSCNPKHEQNYLFFLHNRFVEEHALTAEHPEYGRTQYHEIISTFEAEGFKVISEIRPANTNARDYAMKVKKQIDSLLSIGIPPNQITVLGTSKGGYIAQYVSTFAQNPNLNFVFIASFRENDIADIPEISYCGNILNIYEKTDAFGVSAISRKNSSKLPIKRFVEIELNTGLKHGFLFKPLKEWIVPAVQWGKQNYSLH